MKFKIIAPVLLVVVAVLMYCSGFFDSPETRIRNLFSNAVASFDETHLAGCIGGFAEDYRDETESRLDRNMLSNILRFTFISMVDAKTKLFLLRLRMPDDSMSVEIDEAAGTANVAFTLHLERQRKKEWQPQWQLSVSTKLIFVEGNWRIHRSSHETVEGARPR